MRGYSRALRPIERHELREEGLRVSRLRLRLSGRVLCRSELRPYPINQSVDYQSSTGELAPARAVPLGIGAVDLAYVQSWGCSSFDRTITLGLDGARRALGLATTLPQRRLPVLMYHSLSDDEEPVGGYHKVCTPPSLFRSQMDWMRATGFHGVDLSTGIRWLRDGVGSIPGLPEGAKPVAITFDDGFREFYRHGLPALADHGFQATMYVPTSFIGDVRKTFLNRDCMTWAELRECLLARIELGSHTVSHPVLYSLPWREIKSELHHSKQEMEQQLQRAVEAFAYPFALPSFDQRYLHRLEGLLQETGYATCATTLVGRAAETENLLRIKRIPANSSDDQPLFLAKLRGSYDWMGGVQTLVKLKGRLRKPEIRRTEESL